MPGSHGRWWRAGARAGGLDRHADQARRGRDGAILVGREVGHPVVVDSVQRLHTALDLAVGRVQRRSNFRGGDLVDALAPDQIAWLRSGGRVVAAVIVIAAATSGERQRE